MIRLRRYKCTTLNEQIKQDNKRNTQTQKTWRNCLAFHLWNCWLSAYNTFVDDGTHDNNVISNSFITTVSYSIRFCHCCCVVFSSRSFAGYYCVDWNCMVPSLLRICTTTATATGDDVVGQKYELCVRPSKYIKYTTLTHHRFECRDDSLLAIS